MDFNLLPHWFFWVMYGFACLTFICALIYFITSGIEERRKNKEWEKTKELLNNRSKGRT